MTNKKVFHIDIKNLSKEAFLLRGLPTSLVQEGIMLHLSLEGLQELADMYDVRVLKHTLELRSLTTKVKRKRKPINNNK